MKAGLIQIADAIADQIRRVVEQVDGIDVQVERGFIVNPTPPTVDIYFGDVARDADSAAFDDVSGAYIFTVRTRSHTADVDAGMELLWQFADDTDDLSLANAILDDPTLNGYASSVDVREFSGLRAYENLGNEGFYLGFQFTVLALPAES